MTTIAHDLSIEGTSPPNGWITELQDAKADAKRDANDNRQNSQALFRVARAYYKLRQWKNCKKAAERALKWKPPRACKQKLRSLIHAAESELQIPSHFLSHPEEAAHIIKSARDTSHTMRDYIGCPHRELKNSNLLQCAAINGEIRLLEAIIAEGVAIDFPFLGPQSRLVTVAPTNATALLMTCARMAWGVIKRREDCAKRNIAYCKEDKFIEFEECAVCLIRHGANCDVKLTLDLCSSDGARINCIRAFRKHGFDGKSAKELAVLAESHETILTMDEYEGVDAKMSKVICRCGSRLPWKDCHAGGPLEISPFINGQGESRLDWRLSPVAKCPCGHSEKDYFECCWSITARPVYKNDSTGGSKCLQFGGMQVPGTLSVSRLQHIFTTSVRDNGVDNLSRAFPEASSEASFQEHRAIIIRDLLSQASSRPDLLLALDGPCSRLADWNVEVYAGCVARLDHWFLWRSNHWMLDKRELLDRVKAWNTALEKYCDDNVDLVGNDRDRVMRLHTASAFAHCGRVECNKLEEKVKAFSRCSICRAVAYCSPQCQKLCWRDHKKGCRGISF